MKTKVYKSYADFLKRDDKRENGVSQEYALKHPDFEERNKTNTGRWNSYLCDYCTYIKACKSSD